MEKNIVIAVLLACMLTTPFHVYANADDIDDYSTGDINIEEISGNNMDSTDLSTDPSTFKKVTVPIDKEYESCQFTMTYENPGSYSCTILSPKGKEYTAYQNSKQMSTCKIDNVDVGDWIVRVISNEGNSIGKVKIDVSAVSKSRNQIVDEVPIGKDINGLKIYFKDDSIAAEWKDTSVGSVHVVVYNTKNQVTIADEKVAVGTNYFETQLPTGVEQVTISLVPTASEGFDEAETIRTYTVNNYPNAYVTFPDITYTNKGEVEFDVKLNEEYGIEIYNNDRLQETIPRKPAGTYSYKASLEEGNNKVQVYIVDADGNKRSTKADIIVDTVPPVLLLNESYTDVSTYEETYTINGNVRDFATLTIDGYDVEPRSNGDFLFDVPLYPGNNAIDIVVTDQAGNSVTYAANVTMLVKEEKNISVSSIFSYLIIAVVGIGFLLHKKYKFLPRSLKDDDIENAENDMGNEQGSTQKEKKVKKNPKIKKDEKEDTAEKKNIKEKQKKEKKKGSRFNLDVIYYACIPVVVYLLVSFVFYNAVIPSDSMAPSIEAGDGVICNRLAYKVREPQRGQIIVFKNGTRTDLPTNTDIIKRIIGVPGDTITFKDGNIYINGDLGVEDYLSYDTETNPIHEDEKYVVPENSYFVLGDNRGNSMDSRYWEDPYVKSEDIIGKYLYSFQMPDFLLKFLTEKNNGDIVTTPADRVGVESTSQK